MRPRKAPLRATHLRLHTAEQALVDREIEGATEQDDLAELRSKRNSLSSIGRLPADVLLEIFRLLPGHPLDTVLLVCRQWAKICSTSFSLWRVSAMMGLAGDGDAELARIAEYQHNRIHALEIPWFGFTDLSRTQKKVLKDIAPYLMVLRVPSAAEHAMHNFLEHFLRLAFTRLSSLHLHVSDRDFRVGNRFILPLAELQTPSLQTLSLRHLCISEPGALPSLTRLNLAYCRGVTEELLLGLLRQTPQLRWLTLEYNLTAAPNAGTADRHRVVQLERLERLRIAEAEFSLNALAQQLVFPSSTTLEFRLIPSLGDWEIPAAADIQPVLNLAKRFRPISESKASFIVLDGPVGDHDQGHWHTRRNVQVLSGTAECNVCLFSFELCGHIRNDDDAGNAIILALCDVLVTTLAAPRFVLSLSRRNVGSFVALLEVLAAAQCRASGVRPEPFHTIELHLDYGVDWLSVKERFLPALLDFFVASERECGKPLPLMKVRVTQGERRKWSAALRKMKTRRERGLDGLVDRVEVQVVPTRQSR